MSDFKISIKFVVCYKSNNVLEGTCWVVNVNFIMWTWLNCTYKRLSYNLHCWIWKGIKTSENCIYVNITKSEHRQYWNHSVTIWSSYSGKGEKLDTRYTPWTITCVEIISVVLYFYFKLYFQTVQLITKATI